MFKLMGKKIITILRSNILLNCTYENGQLYDAYFHKNLDKSFIFLYCVKETRSVTMNIFRILFFFKSFVKIELSYIFTINIVSTAENCKEK